MGIASNEPASTDMLRTTVGDLALEEVDLSVRGRTFHILHTGAIVTNEDELRFLGSETQLPYGIVLWPGAIALAHEVALRSFEGKRVLELGAGTGLPGIVAASLGARVVQTDRQPVALFLSKKNAERNGVSTIEHRDADFRTWQDAAKYDCILGADILYADGLHAPLMRIFDANLAEGGSILLSDPFRKSSLKLLEAMEADGWRVSLTKWTVGIAPPPRPVGVYELTR